MKALTVNQKFRLAAMLLKICVGLHERRNQDRKGVGG